MEWMDVNGACLRYELAGKAGAPIVVLIHEIGGCIESWDETLPAVRREFRTLRYDQRGFGLSEKVSGPSMALDDLVNDIVAMLDALAIHEPVHVAGSALGSGIAAAFAARHPARVARWVAIAGCAMAVLATAAEAQRVIEFARIGRITGKDDLRLFFLCDSAHLVVVDLARLDIFHLVANEFEYLGEVGDWVAMREVSTV